MNWETKLIQGVSAGIFCAVAVGLGACHKRTGETPSDAPQLTQKVTMRDVTRLLEFGFAVAMLGGVEELVEGGMFTKFAAQPDGLDFCGERCCVTRASPEPGACPRGGASGGPRASCR